MAYGKTFIIGDTWYFHVHINMIEIACSWGACEVQAEIDSIEDSWHYVAATYDGEEVPLYLDGEKVKSKAISVNTRGGQPLTIGYNFWDDKKDFNGAIDEVCLYNRALKEDKIRQNYKAKVGPGGAVNPAGKIGITWGKIKTSK